MMKPLASIDRPLDRELLSVDAVSAGGYSIVLYRAVKLDPWLRPFDATRPLTKPPC